MTATNASGAPDKRAILLVDDDPSVLVTTAALLEDDYVVFCAKHGSDALSLLDTVEVEVVCADLRMAGMDGLELLEEVARRFPRTSAVLVTGHRDLLARKDANQVAAYTVLLKPYTLAELVESIERAIRRTELKRPTSRPKYDPRWGQR
jgi:DNA-binding NtrC family response regulator